MKRLWLICLAAAFMFVGCAHYSARQVPLNEPKDQPYCQKVGDMEVGADPYMVRDKTILVFGKTLRWHKVLAVSVSMMADGDAKYTVKKSDITAMDEFGNKYAPLDAEAASEKIECTKHNEKECSYVKNSDMPDVVTVSGKLEQHFLFFDMKPNHANARKFTIDIPATSASGDKTAFSMTVDPMLGERTFSERWQSYDGRGISWCGKQVAMAQPMAMAPASPAMGNDDAAKRAEEAAARAEEAARKAEAAANKGEKTFEKSLLK